VKKRISMSSAIQVEELTNQVIGTVFIFNDRFISFPSNTDRTVPLLFFIREFGSDPGFGLATVPKIIGIFYLKKIIFTVPTFLGSESSLGLCQSNLC
jgi:hypothetical protein